jgi:atypical dual specificity phosphatase
MLSFNPQPWQTSLIAAAQQRSGRRPSIRRRGYMASEVLPRLYLTDLFTARDEVQLTSLGITHIVSVLECAPTLPQTQSLRTLHIPLSDNADQDILTHLPAATSFIRNALADPNSRVLVSSWLRLLLFSLVLNRTPFFSFRSTALWALAEAQLLSVHISSQR